MRNASSMVAGQNMMIIHHVARLVEKVINSSNDIATIPNLNSAEKIVLVEQNLTDTATMPHARDCNLMVFITLSNFFN